MLKSRVSARDFVILIAMSIVGIISSTIVIIELNIVHSLPPYCKIPVSVGGNVLNCAKVLLSPYASIGPFSLDFLAAIWFIINIIFVVSIAMTSKSTAKKVLNIMFVWRFLGIIVVGYLLFLEFVVLHAICVYCTAMHIAIVLDFVIVSYILFSKKSKIRQDILSQ
ncbi:MAG: Vitamin K epoxide reductase [Candidatus Parvarchaeum acidophilus ARMAN-5]|jgi:uncharacterized membrane protein|uniref:Vitamin K epoxide reductase n=1 Tax=Candidatus Parvarchaeum acidophilus ARMAN-5 TaxID=662762 RepID=D6GVQ8_PARA5|nr:MAG: Vitamin K epoxide reductase [Candidatus Parvarchaeum acidophilus ARMAN-5]